MSPLRDDVTSQRAARWLTLVLRLAGGLMVLATGAVFLPDAWMAKTHAWLGMGTLPSEPIVGYLARSASVLYAIHGGLYLVVATDVVRFRPVVRYLAVAGVLFGVVITGIDLASGMPLYWTLLEGPPVAGFGIVLVGLSGRLPRRA